MVPFEQRMLRWCRHINSEANKCLVRAQTFRVDTAREIRAILVWCLSPNGESTTS